MPGVNSSIVQFEIKKIFLRDRAVMTAYERKRTAALRRFGTILRRHARGKLRRKGGKGKVSAPGTPPLTHTGEPNLRTILYGFDGRTLIVGPVGLSGAKRGEGPELHEHGGNFVIRIFNRRKKQNERVRAYFPQRPFMFPTLVEKQDELGRSIEKVGGLV